MTYLSWIFHCKFIIIIRDELITKRVQRIVPRIVLDESILFSRAQVSAWQTMSHPARHLLTDLSLWAQLGMAFLQQVPLNIPKVSDERVYDTASH